MNLHDAPTLVALAAAAVCIISCYRWSQLMMLRVARLEWALAVLSKQTGHVDAVEEILTGKVEAWTPQGRAFRG
jgi:hypothetical protein